LICSIFTVNPGVDSVEAWALTRNALFAVELCGSPFSVATDPNNGLTPCQIICPFHPGILREREEPDGLQKIYFLIGVCLVQKRGQALGSRVHTVASSLRQLFPNGRKLMSDNNEKEKVLPVLRLLLVAFFGLLFVIALQLFLLVSGAKAGSTEAHRSVAPLSR
jgi:hypothetical protein